MKNGRAMSIPNTPSVNGTNVITPQSASTNNPADHQARKAQAELLHSQGYAARRPPGA